MVDSAAFAVQLAFQASALARGDVTVRPGKSLVYSDPGEPCFDSLGFSAGKLTAADALVDPSLLAVLTPVDTTRTGHRDSTRAQHEHGGDKETDYLSHFLLPLSIESRHPST